jgi:flagellar L-ring protein FlgH
MTMASHITRTTLRLAVASGVVAGLSGCNLAQRIGEVGSPPPLTNVTNPTMVPGYQPVSMPMPTPQSSERQASSLWRAGARAFLKDQRAARVGDIVTVTIQISDKAEITNTSKRSRNNREAAGVPSLLGYEASLNAILPQAVNPSSLIDLNSNASNEGVGSVKRDETINLRIAAVVTQILPNGNMVIQGRQETRVNFEVRELQIAGVIRQEDITSENAIRYDKIAEARISYGGRGQIMDVQQPRYGQQVLDIIMPF